MSIDGHAVTQNATVPVGFAHLGISLRSNQRTDKPLRLRTYRQEGIGACLRRPHRGPRGLPACSREDRDGDGLNGRFPNRRLNLNAATPPRLARDNAFAIIGLTASCLPCDLRDMQGVQRRSRRSTCGHCLLAETEWICQSSSSTSAQRSGRSIRFEYSGGSRSADKWRRSTAPNRRH